MTNRKNNPSVLILGGAGFIGSNLAMAFHETEHRVTIIDGLLPKTGGRIENLGLLLRDIEFVHSRVEDCKALGTLIGNSDLVVDCMAWTSHRLGVRDPFYDLKLNVESHLHLIMELIRHPSKYVISMGSRGQYGNPRVSEIVEDTPMCPEDIQGAHKLCAESYFRIYSKLHGLNVASLRITNCFGENQPVDGDDIGLVGGFIKDVLDGKKLDVFDGGRRRSVLYVKDLANVIVRLAEKRLPGFHPFNVGGTTVSIEELAKTITAVAGQGSYATKPMPSEISAIDMGSATMNNSKLNGIIGKIKPTDFHSSLKETIRYFKSMKND